VALEPATGAFLGLLFQLHFVGLDAVLGRSYIEGRGYGAGNRCFSWFAISATFCRIRGSFRKNLHCILIIQQWKRLLLSDSFGFGMSSLVIFSLWRIISFVKRFSPFGCGLCKFKQTMSRKRLMVIADMLAFAKSYSLVEKGQNLAFLNILLPASVSEFLS